MSTATVEAIEPEHLNPYATAENRAFRAEVQAFLRTAVPPDMAERVRRVPHPAREDVSAWMTTLHQRGWSAVGWPEEFGGPGWDPFKRLIFEEECAYADAPPQHFANIHSIGPVIYTFGNQSQKDRFLQPLLAGEEIWCQGFSEPNAGSDLGALATRAVRDGDDYVVTGQKTWTSDAQHADWMFALVRTETDGRSRGGISFLLIDMNSPGLEVRPIRMIDGWEMVNEVFFDEVRVPAANLVGSEGQGWTIAKFLLSNERAFSAEVPASKRDLRRLLAIARTDFGGAGPIWNDPLFRAKVARAHCDLVALEYSMIRALGEVDAGASPIASILKVPGSELRQRISELMVEALGHHGVAFYPPPSEAPEADLPGPIEARGIPATYLYRRATTIYGGSNEIQRDIIAKNILGL